jgi:hypothetical protein
MRGSTRNSKREGGVNVCEGPAICGIICYPKSKAPDIYMLYFCDCEPIIADTPFLDEQGRILFCTKPGLIPTIHKMGTPELVRIGTVRKDPIYVYNLCELFRVMNMEDEFLPSSHIAIDTLILLLDCLRALGNSDEYEKVLSPLFCALFEIGSMKSFLQKQKLSKGFIINTVVGAIGLIATNSLIVTEK